MGREGALNQLLVKLGIVHEPVSAFGFSQLSVRLAMVCVKFVLTRHHSSSQRSYPVSSASCLSIATSEPSIRSRVGPRSGTSGP